MKASVPDLIPTDRLHSGSKRIRAIFLVGMLAAAFSGPRQTAAAAAKQPAISAPTLSWQMMRGLNFRTGEMTPELQVVINGVAGVPGYMVPLEDNLEEVTDFLLVPYLGACIHVPPPLPNQIAHVIMYVLAVIMAGLLIGFVPALRAYRNSLADGLAMRL
jgi:hypothetical protein